MATSYNSHCNIFLSPITSDYLDVKLVFRTLKIWLRRADGYDRVADLAYFQMPSLHMKVEKTTPFFFQIFEMVKFDRFVRMSTFFAISHSWYKCTSFNTSHYHFGPNKYRENNILMKRELYIYVITVSFFRSDCFK